MSPIAYPFSATADGRVSLSALSKELEEVGFSQRPVLMPAGSSVLHFLFGAEPSPADRALLDAAIASHVGAPIPAFKVMLLDAIRLKTAALIAAGSFEYPPASGKLFGMSEVSQLNITGAFNSRNEGSFAYPVAFFVKSDLDSVSLADAAAVEAFHVAAVTAIRAIREGGAALKAQVIAAGTAEALAAIVDNR